MMVVTEDIYLYINVKSGSTLTLRSKPDTSSDAIAYFTRGTKVKLLAFDDEWACVADENNRRGFSAIRYLQEEYIAPVATPKPENDDRYEENTQQPEWMRSFRRIDTDIVFCELTAKTKEPAKLYRSVANLSSAMGTIPADMQFTVLAYNEDWAYVTRRGISGFVEIEFITLVS